MFLRYPGLLVFSHSTSTIFLHSFYLSFEDIKLLICLEDRDLGNYISFLFFSSVLYLLLIPHVVRPSLCFDFPPSLSRLLSRSSLFFLFCLTRTIRIPHFPVLRKWSCPCDSCLVICSSQILITWIGKKGENRCDMRCDEI